jgi:formylmethanofuran dehydrogenase subunit B
MARPHAKKSVEATTLADVPCPFCCCACDDLEVRVEGGRITSVEGACEIARPWFLGEPASERPVCRIDGKPAELEEALRRAAELLSAARYPLIYGLSRASCEAQRLAVDIAEILGGVIDAPASRAAAGAMHSVGEVTATFGEIRNRADLLIVWGVEVDPLTSHPRFFERYAPGKRVIAIASKRTATVESADEWIAVRAGGEFDAAVVLQGLAKGLRLSPEQVNERTGVELAVWQSLFERIKQARYGVLLTGDVDDSPAERRDCEALAHLVRGLNRHTRFVSIGLQSTPNGLGAENVLAWRTGYPAAVDFSHGFPRYDPVEVAAENLLAAGRVDAVLVICDDPLTRLSATAKQRFADIPSIAIDWRQSATMRAARIAIPLATIGVESGGTIFRADGVPLALRPPITAQLPADYEAIGALRAAVVEAIGKYTPHAPS